MTAKRLAYFEQWVDPITGSILQAQPDIQVSRLVFSATDEGNWAELARVQGYQCPTRTDVANAGVGTRWLVNAALLERCPNLLAVSVAGAGYDVVDVDACTRAGVIVCNQSGTGREAVAEHALAFMLALSKKIGVADRTLRRTAGWDRLAFRGNDLLGKTVGIIGLGQIGTRLAELCRGPFGMTVLAFDPYVTAAQAEERGAIKVELPELLSRSDFVSLNSPLSAETAGSFGAAQFAQMKPSAYFITTGRGGVHDEAALVEALRTKRIAGVGVDVFTTEPPPPDHPLFAFDNVLATPHTAGITVEANRGIGEATGEQWLDIFAGRVPPRLINPAAWPAYRNRFERLLGMRPPELPEESK
ncbi:MAG TPA: hydroxyacid dehydrogenase [Burkholderiales bacterium]|nr:hydroxyacid dehydrogenase [Burkholderiales bacterium]